MIRKTPGRAAHDAFYTAVDGKPPPPYGDYGEKNRNAWDAAARAAIDAEAEADLPPWEEILLLKQQRDQLRALLAEILGAVEATTDRAGMQADIAIWRNRAGLGGPHGPVG